MATVFVSPGVFTRELDLSFVPAAVQEIGACLVGPTMAGPAFTPTIINTYEDFRRIYGDTNQELYMPYAAKNYLTNGSTMTVMRVLGTESTTEAGRGYYIRFGGTAMTGSVMAIIRGRSGETLSGAVTMSGTPTDFALAYGIGAEGGTTALNLSFDQGSANYIKNRLGTDPVASGSTDELGTFYIDRVFDFNFDLVNNRGLKYNNPTNTSTGPLVGDASASGEVGQGSLVCTEYNPVDTSGPGPFSAGSGGVTSMLGMQTLQNSTDVTGKFWSSYNNALTPWVVSQNVNGNAQSLFRFHSLESGEGSNTKIKVGIIYQAEQVSASSYPKFTVTIRKFTDTDSNPVGLESFSNVNLDKNSSSYIAKVIGDRYSIWEGLGGAGSPELTFGGQYDNKSAYIRVEMTTDQLQSNHRASGYQGIPKPKTPWNSLMDWVNNSGLIPSANDTEALSAYAGSSIPQLRYKTDNFIQGTTPDPNKYLGVNYDSADISSRLSGLVTLGPVTSATDSTINDPGFMMLYGSTESNSTTAGLSSTIGGWVNDINTTALSGYLPNASSPPRYYYSVYDGVGTAANTAKYYQFTVPLYGGFDALDPRIKLSTAVKNGSLSSAYFDASDILSNADEFDYNLLAFPGVSNASIGNPQARAIDMCAARGDAMFLAELGHSSDGATDDKTMSVATAVQKAAQIDSSYAGAWYPWLRIYDADLDDLVWVPPSVETLGVLAFTDIVADPWFAPAGFNRGGLPNVIEAYRRLTQGQRDTLYEGKVNPIATFAGAGIFVFGQKTLQNAASALDRINVRRMLLYCRKLVASTARTVLFEQNSLQTRNKLSNMINEILRPVKVRQGLSEFRVVINETNNTPDTIDRNQIFGAIYMQPTKTAEMIILDFNIERTGATFEEA